ncbi:MAG: OB-fold protein [Cyclonatronaceae bacterium]
MNKKKIIKISALVLVSGLIIGGGIVLYLFNMPHRDIQSSATDFRLTVSQIVNEYVANPDEANKKYLKDDGQSAILEVEGVVNRISHNMNGETIILLTNSDAPAGVQCTLIPSIDGNQPILNRNDQVVLKGVIRAGTYFDEDFQRYEPVIMDHCSMVK